MNLSFPDLCRLLVKVIGIFLVVLSAVLFSTGSTRAADTITKYREKYSDTEFFDWLEEYIPADTRGKLRRYRLLGRSPFYSAELRYKYLARGTELTGKLLVPRLQIRLALQLGRGKQVDEWLKKWLDRFAGNIGRAKKMIDLLLNQGAYKRARDVIQAVRDEHGQSRIFYRRLALTYYGSGNYRGALEVYLRTARHRYFSSYLRSRILGLVKKEKLGDYFLQRIQQKMSAPNSGRLYKLAMDYLIHERSPVELVEFIESCPAKNRQIRIKRLRRVRKRLIQKKKYNRAFRVGQLIEKKYSSKPGDILALARIHALDNRPDSALRKIVQVDTTSLSGANKIDLTKVKARSYLLLKKPGQVRQSLESFPATGLPELAPLWFAYFRFKNDYPALLEYLDKISGDYPWIEFYAHFMTGQGIDTALQELINTRPTERETAVALAIAGFDKKERVRGFYRWYDRYPLNSSIDTGPAIKSTKSKYRLPRVLLGEWVRRLNTGAISPENLAGWGRKFSYPRLLYLAAKKYYRQDKIELARPLLEQILMKFSESMYRFRAEKLLDKLS